MFRLHSDMRAKGLSSVRPTPELFCGVSDRHPCRLYAMHYMRKLLLLPLELLWCMVRYISSACPTTGKKKIRDVASCSFRHAAISRRRAAGFHYLPLARFTDVWSFGNPYFQNALFHEANIVNNTKATG